jgi:hypothetical protein
LSSLKTNKASVFVFLAPDCPLSRSYTLTLKDLDSEFRAESVRFYGVVAGERYELSEVQEFVQQHGLNFPVLLDRSLNLQQLFEAQVTPEVFVVDSNATTLYRGAIDNWAVDLGQHRQVITEHYLSDALLSIARGEEVHRSETPAIGCFIE